MRETMRSPQVTLNNGVALPALGPGVYPRLEGGEVAEVG